MGIFEKRELEIVYAVKVKGGAYHSPLCDEAKEPDTEPMFRGRAEQELGKQPCSRCVAGDFGHRVIMQAADVGDCQ